MQRLPFTCGSFTNHSTATWQWHVFCIAIAALSVMTLNGASNRGLSGTTAFDGLTHKAIGILHILITYQVP